MFSTVLSAALQGLQVEFIDVEADLSNGLPMFHMVGYLSSEVKEAGERVRTAIRNSGLVIPAKKIVVNLSPADVRKRGTAFDLPIAVSILASLGLVSQERLEKTVFVGELSLDGRVEVYREFCRLSWRQKNMVFNPVWCQKKMKVKESLSRELK